MQCSKHLIILLYLNVQKKLQSSYVQRLLHVTALYSPDTLLIQFLIKRKIREAQTLRVATVNNNWRQSQGQI